jgi:citrate lyase subunit beta / citryl-CoA lyase
MLLRSWMFVPGDRQRMIEKSLRLPVDAIMMDIEDGVAPAAKETARRQIAVALDDIAARRASNGANGGGGMPARFVRINAVGHERMHADLSCCVRPALDGLVLPKIEHPEQVEAVDRFLDAREKELGVESGTVRLLAAIESPRGLLQAHAIASASPRVCGLMFGAEDFSREVGLPLRREGEARDLVYARSAIVTAAAAARVHAIDGVWTDLADSDGLARFAAQSRRLGFSGMSLIHPSQIEAVNAAFTPSAEEIDHCRRVLAAFEEAERRNEGAIAFGGQLLDIAIVERARQMLALFESVRS